MTKNIFITDEESNWESVGEKITRKIVTYDDHLMFVKVRFEKGGVGAIHQHIHSQISYVESGRFEVEISGKKQILSQGDTYIVPSNELHGCICLETGTLIDMFSPMRADFVK
jgi:quercetin dioxygenase-like cupin family protein